MTLCMSLCVIKLVLLLDNYSDQSITIINTIRYQYCCDIKYNS